MIESRQDALDRLYRRLFGGDKPPLTGQAEAGQSESTSRKAASERNGRADPPTNYTDDEVVGILLRAKNAEKVNALMAGDISAYGDDDSRADAALCCFIAFVTRDKDQIERIFGRSKLAQREKWLTRPDYRAITIDGALAVVTEQYRPGRVRGKPRSDSTGEANGTANDHAAGKQTRNAEGGRLGPLTLKPGAARRTAGGNVRVQVGALLDGSVVYDFVLTPSPNSWRQHASMLEQLAADLPDRTAILKTFAQLVAEAGRRADAPRDPDETTVESIVKELAAPRWQLTARTAKGAAWSEARGGEVTRFEFIACVDDELMAACGEADDAPKDLTGRPCRPDLLRIIQGELQVQWATLMRTLPPLADADMGRASAAGRAFREAMMRLWTATRTFEIAKTVAGTSGETVAARASLISRVRSQAKDYLDGNVSPRPREKWHSVQHAFDGWWRPYVTPGDGEIGLLLAMRWTLTGQVGIELPGVTDQNTLTNVGIRFGCIDPDPAVPGILSGGKTRLAVLSLSLTGELLEMPQDEDQENQDADPVTPGDVTEAENLAP
jgi:hypothetical protein